MIVRHTIHEVATLLGISTDTIRLYEKEGLVSPLRDPSNGYRYYDAEQIHRVMGIYLYRQLHVSISEIREILAASSLYDVCNYFGSFIQSREIKIHEIQHEIQKLTFMQQHLNRLAQSVNNCCLRPMPSHYILYEQPFSDLLYNQLKGIFRSPSFSFGNFCYTLSLNSGFSYQPTSLRFLVQDSMMDLSPYSASRHLFPFHKSRSCVYSVYAFDHDFPPVWDLSPLLDYAKDQQLSCSNEAYAIYVYSLMGDSEKIFNYYEVYVPLLF